jgi:hypothetical protein
MAVSVFDPPGRLPKEARPHWRRMARQLAERGAFRPEEVGGMLDDFAIEAAKLDELREAAAGAPLTVLGGHGSTRPHPAHEVVARQVRVVRDLRRDLLAATETKRVPGRPLGDSYNPLRALQEQIDREGFDPDPDSRGTYPTTPEQRALSEQIRREREESR